MSPSDDQLDTTAFARRGEQRRRHPFQQLLWQLVFFLNDHSDKTIREILLTIHNNQLYFAHNENLLSQIQSTDAVFMKVSCGYIHLKVNYHPLLYYSHWSLKPNFYIKKCIFRHFSSYKYRIDVYRKNCAVSNAEKPPAPSLSEPQHSPME